VQVLESGQVAADHDQVHPPLMQLLERRHRMAVRSDDGEREVYLLASRDDRWLRFEPKGISDSQKGGKRWNGPTSAA
jgi:hypothetical protein